MGRTERIKISKFEVIPTVIPNFEYRIGRDAKTRNHRFYWEKTIMDTTQLKPRRSMVELLITAVIGGALMYYGAVALVAVGVWGHRTFMETKRWAIAGLVDWDLGNFEMSVDTKNQVLINDRLPTEAEARKLLYIALEKAGTCQANIAEIEAITNIYSVGGKHNG